MLQDTAKYFKEMIHTDESNHPCARTLLKIIGFKEINEKDAKLPEVVFKFVPGFHKTVWYSDKYTKVVATINFDGEENGYFWVASKSKKAVEQIRETAKKAVSIYLGHYSKEWVRVLRSVESIDFDLVNKQTIQDLTGILSA